MDDEYKKFLTSTDNILRSYRSAQDEMERLLRPQLDIQSKISQLLGPYDYARLYLDAFADPTKRLREEIQRNLYPAQSIKARLQGFLSPHLETRKQLEEILRPQRWIQDHIESLLKPQVDLVESIRSQLDITALAREQVIGFLDPINCFLSELQAATIAVDASGNVSIDGDEVSAAEISAVADTYAGGQATVGEFVGRLVGWLEQLAPYR